MTDCRVRILSWCVLGVCAVLVAGTATALGWKSQGAVAVSGYGVGEHIDVPLDWLAEERQTLLVFLRSDCAASRQFVAELAGRLDDAPLKTATRIVMPAGQGSAEADTQLARAAGFGPAAIRAADFSALRLRLVPSLVLVDRDGRVMEESAGTAAAVAMLQGLRVGSAF